MALVRHAGRPRSAGVASRAGAIAGRACSRAASGFGRGRGPRSHRSRAASPGAGPWIEGRSGPRGRARRARQGVCSRAPRPPGRAAAGAQCSRGRGPAGANAGPGTRDGRRDSSTRPGTGTAPDSVRAGTRDSSTRPGPGTRASTPSDRRACTRGSPRPCPRTSARPTGQPASASPRARLGDGAPRPERAAAPRREAVLGAAGPGWETVVLGASPARVSPPPPSDRRAGPCPTGAAAPTNGRRPRPPAETPSASRPPCAPLGLKRFSASGLPARSCPDAAGPGRRSGRALPAGRFAAGRHSFPAHPPSPRRRPLRTRAPT